jgi:glycosyltransferase involved in cell wall biosynthesis
MKSKNKEKRDVLFLLTQDLECPSGLGRYFPLSKNLAKHDLKVSIAALHSNYSALEKHSFTKEGVKVDYVSQMHVRKEGNATDYFNFFSLLWISLKATWKLLIFTLITKANVIIIGKPHPMNSIAGYIGGRLLGAKIILDSDDYEATSNYFSSSWQKWVVRIFENTVPKMVDHITTNTIYNKQRMISSGIPSKKIDYIPNGVDQERFEEVDPKKVDELTTTLSLDNQKVIAYIGSLSLANHPVDLLMKSFKIISDKMENIKLLIVGGGKDLDELINLAFELKISDHVIFTGRVSPDLVPHYYEIADVTVDPVYNTNSAKGRCPLKMFESWASGTPFVTSDVGDRAILAGEEQAALLAKPGEPHDLAKKIITILNNPKLANYLCQTYQAKVREYYWGNLVNKNWIVFT